MKTIYFARHGQTFSNAKGLVQDGTSMLSEKGVEQAKILASRLKSLKFDNLLVSDHERTKQTVAPLLDFVDVKPVYTPLVRETKRPTQFAGADNDGPEYHAYLDSSYINIADANWHFADEENFYDVVGRVRDFFNHIDTLQGDTVVISHGRFIIYIMLYVIMGSNLTPDIWLKAMHSFKTINTGISVVQFDDKHQHWLVRTYNDHAHFAE